MKKLIREGVFETNSSSAHSISLGKDTGKAFVLDTIYPDSNGNITIYGGEFGWEFDRHHDARTKASYALTSGVSLDLLRDIIMEQTGAKSVSFWPGDGYVDHESVGVCPNDLESLREFIFNKNSWLFTGNDNSTEPFDLKVVPSWLPDGTEVPVKFTHRLTIRGLKPVKFTSTPTHDEILDALQGMVPYQFTIDNKAISDLEYDFVRLTTLSASSIFGWDSHNLDHIDFENNHFLALPDNVRYLKYDLRTNIAKSHPDWDSETVWTETERQMDEIESQKGRWIKFQIEEIQ